MMKHTNKICALLLALVMVASLAACSAKDAAQDAKETETAQTPEAAAFEAGGMKFTVPAEYAGLVNVETDKDDMLFSVAEKASVEAADYEDAIRGAVSVGGDSDTIAAICGGMAEALFGIPEELRLQGLGFLDAEQTDIVSRFEAKYGAK